VRVSSEGSTFSLRHVEDIISAKDKYRSILEKTNEALLTYAEEIKKMKRFLIDSSDANDMEE